MISFLFNRYQSKSQNSCTDEKVDDKIICAECCSEFTIFEILNHNYRCPKCGKLIEVPEDKRPTVFT